MSLSKRAIVAPLVTAATIAALVFGTGAINASADAPSVTGVLSEAALTLPYADGFNDDQTLTITSTSDGDVIVSSGAFPDQDVSLPTDNGDGTFSGTLDVGALEPTAGTYATTLSQDGLTPVAGPQIVVGSGQARNVTVDVTSGPIYVDGGGVASIDGTISATDETNTQLPLHSATWDITDSAGTHTTGPRVLDTNNTSTSIAFVSSDLAGWSIGDATLEASNVTGPDTTYAGDDSLAVPLLDVYSFIGVHVVRSIPIVYPVKDGYRDSVSFTVSPVSDPSNDLSYNYTGSVVIKHGATTVKTLSFSGQGEASRVTWDGLTAGKLVSGTYSVAVTMTVPNDHKTLHNVTTVGVSSKRLHAHKKSVVVGANTFFAASRNVLGDHVTKLGFTSASKFERELSAKKHTSSGTGSCSLHGKTLECSSTKEGESARFGYVGVPAAIVASAALKPYQAKIGIKVTEQKHSKTAGPLYEWLSDNRGAISDGLITKKGYKTTPTASFSSKDNAQGILIVTVNSASIHVSKIKLSYTYYTLS